ncbi:MAG: DUF4199 domain-containing protein [Muribaculaceae bacterium]|nr:DUF4199 domain-containing protein [Muribaculaceae bacterium]
MDKKQRTVYKQGADDGFVFGAYLSVLFLMLGYSPYYPVLSLPALVLILFVPFVIYKMLRRSYVRDLGLTDFSALWLQGIVTFVCGTLLMGCVAFVFMRYLKPGFIVEQVQSAADIYRSMSDAGSQHLADTLDLMVERHLLPAPIYVAVELMLMGIFSGSILSMALTWLVRMRKVDSQAVKNGSLK